MVGVLRDCPPPPQPVAERHEAGRVDAPAQAGAYGDVATEVHPDGFLERLSHGRGVGGPGGARLGRRFPVARGRQARGALAEGHQEARRRLHLADALEERRLGLVTHARQQEALRHGRIRLPGQALDFAQPLELRRERQPVLLGQPRVVQRLYPEPVAGEEQDVAVEVDHGERPHADETADAVRPPFEVRVQQDLRVPRRFDRVATRQKLVAQLDEVVDLAVVGDRYAASRREHRLRGAVGEVEDRQPPVGECGAGGCRGPAEQLGSVQLAQDLAFDDRESFPVGPAVAQSVGNAR